MDTEERVLLHEGCVVPYRHTASGVEFCLLTPSSENRWEFPKISLDVNESAPLAQISQAATAAGLRGELAADDGPLGHFSARRGSEVRSMDGYLMRVTEVDDDWSKRGTHRRLWCLAEEARARIRRKPLRQFIDAALQSISADRRSLAHGRM